MAKGAAKKVAPAPKTGTAKPAKKASKDWKSQHGHLFVSEKRDHGCGKDIMYKRDLSRVVRWPRYIRLQRQKSVLKKRLKIPPTINQFNKTLDKNQAGNLFRLLAKYRPESAEEKKARRTAAAAGGADADAKKPKVLKFGLNHVTTLIEEKKAKLVVIAHDVDPVELVVWLPALCRKMQIPYCIVKGKARLGTLVHSKTATAIAVTEVNKEDQAKLTQLIENFNHSYLQGSPEERKTWGGGIMGNKTMAALRLRAKAAERQAAKVAKL